jgi:arabinose-5-phosphate isomerase
MDIKSRAQSIFQIQRIAIDKMEISDEMIKAIEKIVSIRQKGRIITTGMGKAGIIATKMSATLASIGFPSFYVNPAESGHGDLGRISSEDLMIVFSNSGNTSEVISMIANLHELNAHKNFVICIGSTDKPKISTDLAISYGKVPESCIVSKVPSTTTTLMLIIADILAITAAESIGFNDEWFKIRHPSGAIGQEYKERK